MIAEMQEALKVAIGLIKTWHNSPVMSPLSEQEKEEAWRIYYEHAPEMKPVRDAFAFLERQKEDVFGIQPIWSARQPTLPGAYFYRLRPGTWRLA